MLEVAKGRQPAYVGPREVEVMRASASAVIELLNDILDSAQLEDGALRIDPRQVNLHQLASDTLALFGTNGSAPNIEFKLEYGTSVPDIVQIDPIRVRQILTNLLHNAVKFTDLGKITVRVLPERKDFVAIEVEDTGIGIAADAQTCIFDRFSQVDDSIARRYGGTGLGLSICWELTRLMGGELTVRSEPKKGSVFRFFFHAPAIEQEGGDGLSLPTTANQNQPALDILIVDDQPTNIMVLSILLEQLGHMTTKACSAREALDLLDGHRFDVVLMDIHMPDMDGLKATKILRARNSPNAKIPVIACTASAMTKDLDDYARAGMSGCISKPIQRDDLVQILQRVLIDEGVCSRSA